MTSAARTPGHEALPTPAPPSSAPPSPAPRSPTLPQPRVRRAVELFTIGQMAERAGVSERTLRYYEEIGLMKPASRPPGRIRRYSEADLARVARIRELRELMGFNLDEVGSVLASEDRVQALREEFRSAPGDALKRAELLAVGLALQEDLRSKVIAKAAHLASFLAELDARIERVRDLASVIGEEARA